MAKYHGGKGLVYMSTTGTGAAASVGALTSWTLDQRTDKVDVTAFTDTNKTYVQGLKDVTGTFAGFFDDSITNTLATAAASTDGVKIYLYPSSDVIARYFYGPAWVDLSVSNDVNAAVRVSGSFAANGAWGNKLS